MVTIGTPKSATATKVVLCGSGELGKEFVIELQRYGVEVITVWDWIRKRKLGAMKIGKEYRISADDIARFEESRCIASHAQEVKQP